MNRNKIASICLGAVLVLGLAACDGLEFGSTGRANVPPTYTLDDDGDDDDGDNDVVHVNGVSINEASPLVLTTNDSYQLTATVTPTNASDKSLIWTPIGGDRGTSILSVEDGLVKSGSETGFNDSIMVTTAEEGYSFSDSIDVWVVSEEDAVDYYTISVSLAEGVEVPEYAELWLVSKTYGNYQLTLDDSSGNYTTSILRLAVGKDLDYAIYLAYTSEYRDMSSAPAKAALVSLSNDSESGEHTVTKEDKNGTLSLSVEELPTDTIVSPYEFEEVNIQIDLYSTVTDSETGVESKVVATVEEGTELYIGWSDASGASHSPVIENTTEGTDAVGKLTLLESDNPTEPIELTSYTYTFTGEVPVPGTVSLTIYIVTSDITSIDEYEGETLETSFDLPYFYSGATLSAKDVVNYPAPDTVVENPD